MPTVTIKYSQPMNSVVGDPATVATNLAIFKAQEKALLSMLGETSNKQSIKPSTSPGQIIDWTVDIHMPGPEEEQQQNPRRNTRADPAPQQQQQMSPDVAVNAVSASSAIGGSGDASDYLKTSLPQAMQDLLKFIISSWKSGYDMNAHNTGMQKWQNIQKLLSQLSSLIPTGIPDGIAACTDGLNIYTQINQVIKNTYLKMPQKLTTDEVKQQLQIMQQVNSLNQTFNSDISSIVICVWMKIAPALKLPIAFNNSTIIIKAVTQILNDWVNNGGTTPDNLQEVEQLLDTLQL